MKGQILTWTSVGFLIMSAIFLLPHLYQNFIADQYPGATSITLFKAHYDAQGKLTFIDQAGMYSLYDVLRNLALQGGFAKPSENCGQHSYNLWSTTDQTQNCFPNEQDAFKAVYPLLFDNYLTQTLYPYTKDNYNYEYTFEPAIQVLGKAKNNLITQSDFNGKHFADYLVKPSYRASYFHSLNVYERLKQWAQETIQNCYDDPPSCLKEAMDAHNQQEDKTQIDSFLLSTDCQDPGADFIESYENCRRTQQRDCLCAIQTQQNLEFKEGKIILQPKHIEYDTTLPVATGTYAGNQDPANRFVYQDQTLTSYKAEFEIKKVKTPLLSLYKEKNGDLIFIQDPNYSDGTPVPLCTINKTRTKLCANTTHEIPYYEPGHVEWKNITIRFALELTDRTPSFPDYSAQDKSSTTIQLEPPNGEELSDGILVQWDKTPYEDGKKDEDVDHYLLYCSQGDFSSKSIERIPTYAFTFDDRKQVPYYTGEKTILVNVLKKVSSSGPYETTLQGCGNEEIHDDPKLIDSLYQLYVTVVDKNGNELNELPSPIHVCPSSYYTEHPPLVDPTGALTIEYNFYLSSIRQECWPRT
ncbi:MAG: hypothetical protein AABX70_02900 [Nanoarchaeota archaeon]